MSDGTDQPALFSSGGEAKEWEGGEKEEALEEEAKDSAAEKFLFRIWKTSSTTVTVTTLSTNRSVTVSVSIMCTYPGLTFPACP